MGGLRELETKESHETATHPSSSNCNDIERYAMMNSYNSTQLRPYTHTHTHTHLNRFTCFSSGDLDDIAGLAQAHTVDSKHPNVVAGVRTHVDQSDLRLQRVHYLHRCGRSPGCCATRNHQGHIYIYICIYMFVSIFVCVFFKLIWDTVCFKMHVKY